MKAKVFIPVFFSVVSVVVIAGAGIFQFIKEQQDTVPLSVEKKSIRVNPKIVTYRNTTSSSNLQSRRNTTNNSNNLNDYIPNIPPPTADPGLINNNDILNQRCDQVALNADIFTLGNSDDDGSCFYQSIAKIMNKFDPARNITVQQVRNQIADYMWDSKYFQQVYDFYIKRYRLNQKNYDQVRDNFLGRRTFYTNNFQEYIDLIRNTNEWADEFTVTASSLAFNKNLFIVQSIDDNQRQFNWEQLKINIPHKYIPSNAPQDDPIIVYKQGPHYRPFYRGVIPDNEL